MGMDLEKKLSCSKVNIVFVSLLHEKNEQFAVINSQWIEEYYMLI